MTRIRTISAVVLCLAAAGHAPRSLSAQSDAYMDETARELVKGARARRLTVDRSITDYKVVSSERMSVGYRILGRDRLLFRRETAARIHWNAVGPIDIEVLGAREVVPVAIPKVQIPSDLKNFMPHIAFDPMDSEFLLRFDTTSVMHPFSPTGERNYRFRSGDSTVIRLQSGRTIRLRELEFIPRRRDPSLIAGSFWIDVDTHAVVQAVFRLARAFDFARDADEGDKPPGWLQVGADLSYLAVDYGLYDLRWWLPRYVAAEGVVRLGSFGTMPMKYERTYSDYEVIGDTLAPRMALTDSVFMRTCRPPMEVSISVSSDENSIPDSVQTRKRAESAARRKTARDSIAAADTTRKKAAPCVEREYRITQAPDSALLHSELLPPSVYAGETLLSPNEIEAITDRINDLPEVPWLLGLPRLSFGLSGPGLVRYNRVEGLSVGARAQIDLGRMSAIGEARYGVADRVLSGELALQREALSRNYRLGVFHRLSTTDAAARPFSLTASLGALLFGADETKYYRSTGAELVVVPSMSRTQWYQMRLYAERQTDVDRNTDFSLRHLINDSYVFNPNIEADRATQYGGELTLRRDFGLNPASVRGGIEVSTRAETGTFEFVRPSVTLRATTPLFGRLAFGAEAGAGTSTGTVPTQSLWYLGGTTTLRGYEVGAMSGDSYWRGRAEIATRLPIVRLALFSDAAWAGPRDEWSNGKPLLSVGVGASLLDGIMRVDLAHALREPKGWRLHMYMGGVF